MYSFKKPAKAFLCLHRLLARPWSLAGCWGTLYMCAGSCRSFLGHLQSLRRFCLLLSHWTRCRQSCLSLSEEMENGSTRQQLM